MASFRFEGQRYDHRGDEPVLDTLHRYGISIPFSCRDGVCQVCILQAAEGSPPAAAQAGLDPRLSRQGFVLACRCVPESDDLVLERPDDRLLYSTATVVEKEMLAPDICRLRLATPTPLYYHAGQFINLRRPDVAVRSYSLASVPAEDDQLEIHIRRFTGGSVSQWLVDEVKCGQLIDFQGPRGSCFYLPSRDARPLLLIGTGTGIAPLRGIARDAIASGHRSPIHIFHGVRNAVNLYLDEELSALAAEHEVLTYTACVSTATEHPTAVHGRALDVAMDQVGDLSDWSVFLCGHPEMVEAAIRAAADAGADPSHILADPFVSGRPVEDKENNTLPKPAADRRYPPPDPELWKALGEGRTLHKVLVDLYASVFSDPRLNGFFDGVTQQRALEKQYNFLYQIITGEKVYCGDSPLSAHHWMVISNDLFEHREEILADTLRAHGLDETIVEKIRAISEWYRKDIVKAEPIPKIIDGTELPLDGFGWLDLELGALCDVCSKEIDAGTSVRYHLRLGTLYCTSCMADDGHGS